MKKNKPFRNRQSFSHSISPSSRHKKREKGGEKPFEEGPHGRRSTDDRDMSAVNYLRMGMEAVIENQTRAQEMLERRKQECKKALLNSLNCFQSIVSTSSGVSESEDNKHVIESVLTHICMPEALHDYERRNMVQKMKISSASIFSVVLSNSSNFIAIYYWDGAYKWLVGDLELPNIVEQTMISATYTYNLETKTVRIASVNHPEIILIH